jgi:AAA domain
MHPQLSAALDSLEQHTGYRPKLNGTGYKAKCPCHDDNTPSLSVGIGDDGKLLLHCHAGCQFEDIVAALALEAPARAQETHAGGGRVIVARYDYRDAQGILVRQKFRYSPKGFGIRSPAPGGTWSFTKGGGPAVLYRLPELTAAIADGSPIWIVEGEKDADRLARVGLVATTNIEGAAKDGQHQKWRSEYTAQFSGAAQVYVLGDNDAAGRAHATAVAAALAPVVGAVSIVELPGLPPKGDVSDWLDAGHGVEELVALAEKSKLPQTSEPPQLIPRRLAGLAAATVPPVRYVIEPLLPRRLVSLLGAHGGAGKTLVALILAAHVACGRAWAEFSTSVGRVLFVSLEDGEALARWRLKKIIDAYGLDCDKVEENLIFVDGSDTYGGLAVEVNSFGNTTLEPTSLYLEFVSISSSYDLIIIDNASDAFHGNVNDSHQVRQFIRLMLGDVAKKTDAAVLLLAHIDKVAARFGASGNSYIGSVSWHNTTRSRLALSETEDGGVSMVQEKLNVGKKADPVLLRWNEHGVLVPLGMTVSVGVPLQQDQHAAELFVVFQAAAAAGVVIPVARTGPSTAQHVLATFPAFPSEMLGVKGRRSFWCAIDALLADGRIKQGKYVDKYRHDKDIYYI